jgi:hypothetical protein
MNKFVALFKHNFTKTRNNNLILGRWNYDYDSKIQERKVYLTNMDHCGCCENIKLKTNKNMENKIYENDENDLKPYFY